MFKSFSCVVRAAIPVVLLLTLLFPMRVSGQQTGSTAQSAVNSHKTETIADGILQPAMMQKRLPGLAVGVVHDGKVVFTKGYGVKSFASRQVPDENTVFYIGSLSKGITAVGIMLLVEQGKLSLAAPASTYLKRTSRWSLVSIRGCPGLPVGLKGEQDITPW